MPAIAVSRKIASRNAMTWTEAILISLLALTAALPVCIGLYLVKSALGLNLMAGPSPLHELLYAYVR